MATPAISTLMRKYLAAKAAAKLLKDKAKPLEDQCKLLESQVMERLQEEGKDFFQHGKMVATIESKPAAVAWATEFLKRCGPEACENARLAAGEKQVISIKSLGE